MFRHLASHYSVIYDFLNRGRFSFHIWNNILRLVNNSAETILYHKRNNASSRRNTTKTTFDFDFFQACKQHEYTLGF